MVDKEREMLKIQVHNDPLAIWNAGVEVLETLWDTAYGSLENENGEVVLVTGGWSENEETIALLEKTMFWFLFWESSERGGRYTFLKSASISPFKEESK